MDNLSVIKRQAEVEFPNTRRKNCLRRPWHFFQIASWVLYIFLVITAFGFILPQLPCSWQFTAYGILGILFSGYFVFYFLTISIDTSKVDPNVPVSFKEAENTIPERMHCYIIPVTFYKKRTRFCHVCGKTVFNFDHHSRIFNTCLGGRNFWFYVNCMVTAFLGTICLAIMSVLVLSMYQHLPLENLDLIDSSDKWLMRSFNTTTKTLTVVILLLSFTDCVLCILIAFVLGYHICFHMYMLCRGLTTQEYYESLSNHMSNKSLEAVRPRPCRNVHHPLSIFSVSTSHLYIRDAAAQTEQTMKETSAQTIDRRIFLQDRGLQTEKEPTWFERFLKRFN
ncbi:hypothetical protein GDO78_007657 [Eleutherodactylus coqui]|uniref:Palmitoyltransferase n=1 Tax=Eleutherodactylus coqui TaxID=57060 RepID=A0A8J6FJB5_ELECQ|nr:hypothetical protein GDO78_007657 [Eleutherodactylus coqui]